MLRQAAGMIVHGAAAPPLRLRGVAPDFDARLLSRIEDAD
jgi:hypothetical protein